MTAPRVFVLVATGLGLGLLPKAPGTWASAAATAIGVGLLSAGWGLALLALVVVCAGLGAIACGTAARAIGDSDPAIVVIDELAGQWLALVPAALWVPSDSATSVWLAVAAVGFVAFRLLDILKPWPVNLCERLPGAVGIMADDLVAGALAAPVAVAAGFALR